MRSAIRFYQRLNITPPLTVMMSILGVQGFEFATSTEFGAGYYTHHVDRDGLVLPSTIVQDFTTPAVETCTPVFDALFNAAGFSKWPEYEQYRR